MDLSGRGGGRPAMQGSEKKSPGLVTLMTADEGRCLVYQGGGKGRNMRANEWNYQSNGGRANEGR
jgi:hypothetical protein